MAENETLWNWGNHQKYHADLENYIGTKITEHSSDTVSHITEDERTAWNEKTTIEECSEVFSNPNLLINPDFSINQRGQTEYAASGYTVDGWQIRNGLILTKTEDGINLQNTTNSTQSLLQILSQSDKLLGKIITMSMSVNGIAYTQTAVMPTTPSNASNPVMSIPSVGQAYVFYQQNGNLAYVLRPIAGVSLSVEWAKLELGKIATLDPPSNKAIESLKCQRYLQFHTSGDIDPVDLRPSMRIAPTVTQMEDGRWMYNAEL